MTLPSDLSPTNTLFHPFSPTGAHIMHLYHIFPGSPTLLQCKRHVSSRHTSIAAQSPSSTSSPARALEAEARQSLPALSIRNPRFSYVCARRFESISHTRQASVLKQIQASALLSIMSLRTIISCVAPQSFFYYSTAFQPNP